MDDRSTKIECFHLTRSNETNVHLADGALNLYHTNVLLENSFPAFFK